MYMKNPPKIILWQRCLLLRCVCDVLNAMFNLARDVMRFAFCVQLLNLFCFENKRYNLRSWFTHPCVVLMPCALLSFLGHS